MILRPKLDRPYPDRSDDCQLALEVKLQELIDQAMAAGWESAEAIAAITNLAINLMVADLRNTRTSLSIAQALGRVEH
jgi:hypothetical protein